MSSPNKYYLNGRGSQSNPGNRFNRQQYVIEEEVGVDLTDELESKNTRFLEIFPKTIVNKVSSPDVGMEYSLNPYQGCEHGCTYCYARPTHEFWGYSAGVDFEQVIMVKKNAPELLRQAFEKKSWVVRPIVLSGNTDCYQPCEKNFKLTRQLLEVFLEYRHPVGIITKNVLLKRDLDLFEELAKLNLVTVNISVTTLNEELRRKLEPRTATTARKLDLIEALTQLNVPVNVLAAPIIPALNDFELLAIAKAVAERGAKGFHAHVVRLMGPNEGIFEDWLDKNYPDRKLKILNQLKSIHNGKTGNSNFGDRMKGKGVFALNLSKQLEVANRKYFNHLKGAPLRTDLFIRPPKNGQLSLF